MIMPVNLVFCRLFTSVNNFIGKFSAEGKEIVDESAAANDEDEEVFFS